MPVDATQAMLSARFAALARTDLSISAIGTWDASLPRDSRLLVPVDVQALAVPASGGIDAVPTETIVPSGPDGTPTAQMMPQRPEPFGPVTPRAPGVHLHWAMPDGLGRGDAGAARSDAVAAGNPSGLPPLPDRWVVVRFMHGVPMTTSWVLEADRADHHPIAGWTDPGPLPDSILISDNGRRVYPRETLTVAAGAEVTWAATYDAVVDRFGFHDDLSDLDPAVAKSASFSYLVAGWWSDPALDPLHEVTSVGAFHDRLEWLGWLAPDPRRLFEESATADANRVLRNAVGLESMTATTGGYLARDPLRASDSDPIVRASTTDETQVFLVEPRLLEKGAQLHTAPGPAAPQQTLLHGSVLGVTVDPAGLVDQAPAADALTIAVGVSGYSALSAMLADGSDDARASSERLLAAFASGLLSGIDTPGGLVAIDEDRHSSGFSATAPGVRARPDRIAEGDIMAADRVAPAASVPRTDAASVGSPAQPGSALKVALVMRDDASVLKASLVRRFGAVRPVSKTPRTFRDVAVPLPRAFLPTDLSVVIGGANRSLRHGQDGRFTADGKLACRLPSDVVTGIAGLVEAPHLPPGLTGLGSGAIPTEIDLLVREVALTDPYRWGETSVWATAAYGSDNGAAGNRVRAEVALRNAALPSTRGTGIEIDDGVRDVLRRASLVQGVDPSPVATTRWAQPWVPMWLDWELDLRVSDGLAGWALGPLDFGAVAPEPPDPPLPPEGTPPTRTVTGRTLLTAASARALAAQIQGWLSAEDARDQAGMGQLSDALEGELAAAAAGADGLDVLTCTLGGVRDSLLGLDPDDVARVRIGPDGTPTSKPAAVDLPLLLAGGMGRLAKLRVVDAFGRFIDVPDANLAAAEVATSLDHPDGAPSLRLPPRLQRPSRLLLRFVDPDTADGAPEIEAVIDQEQPDLQISPLAGFLMPDHVDEALEFFDSAGDPLGQLMHDELTGAVVWEGAPGRPGPAGGPPDPGDDLGARHVTRLAAGLVEADARARTAAGGPPSESALSALLRAIDTTLWTVDPLGSLGTGAVAGLVGRPLAVVRATLRLDIVDDLDDLDYSGAPDPAAARAARSAAYDALVARAVRIRLGELTRADDGLVAYAVDDRYRQLRLVAPEVRSDARAAGRLTGQLGVLGHGSQASPGQTPITHPYVSGPTDVALHPGHTVRLTLLMMPGGKVHATCGLLPRKSLALARDWFHDALVRLSPSFRFGPVLVDPATVRLPMVTGLGDRQEFTRRDTPLTWRDDPIVAATQTAYLPEQPATLQEGWIRVQQEQPGASSAADPPAPPPAQRSGGSP